MATASANAIDKSIGTRIFPDASGLRPIASMAFEPIRPIAIAGPNDPMAIARAFASIISIKNVNMMNKVNKYYNLFSSVLPWRYAWKDTTAPI